MSVNNISFILHKPQLSENIGACARGMKNFNFNKLIVVNPKPIFPNDKILATSVGANNIINKAKYFEDLEKLQSFEKKETSVDKNLSSGLEKFKIDVTKEN